MRMDRSDPLLMESPYSAATRPLKDEPLTPEDWQKVYEAHCAFIAQVRMVVVNARTRRLIDTSLSQPVCPMCGQSQGEPSCEQREHWG